MRILIASDSFAPKIDGVAATAGIIATTLGARGHRVVVAAPAPGDCRVGLAEVVRVPSVPCPLYPEIRLSAPWIRLRRLVTAFRPDAAIVLTWGPVGDAVVRALDPGVRLVHIYTTDLPRYLREYHLGPLAGLADGGLRWMSRRAGITLCPTAFVRDELQARGYPRLDIWGRGVDTDLFRPTRRSPEMRERLTGGQPDRPLVLYVGRLAREKRVDDLLRAGLRVSGVRFAIVGDGPERDRLERNFYRVPAVFTGYLRGEALAGAFASADMFAFPSLTDTFGQVVLQAQASGLPTIVARGLAPAELVPEGVSGIHVRPRASGDLAAAITRLAEDRPERERMAAAAVDHARTYSWPALLERLEALLHMPAQP